MRTPAIASTTTCIAACVVVIGALLLGGCNSATTSVGASSSASSAPASEPSASSPPPTTSQTSGTAGGAAGSAQDSVEGTVVRFSGGGTSVDVTIGADTPTTRDFVSLLPFTMQLEEFAGREKIGDPPRELDVEGTPGSDPEDGDLIYFTPWGNLGFYYDTSGVGYSDATPHLGTYQASEEQLSALEGQQVSVQVVG